MRDQVAAPADGRSAEPLFHSRFGGLWTDRRDARALIAEKRTRGAISAEEARGLETWVETGALVLE